MKRLIALLLALAAVISFTACSKKEKDGGDETEGEPNEWEQMGMTQEGYDSMSEIKQILFKENSLIGVSYLGYYEDRSEQMVEFMNRQDYWQDLLFLQEVSPEDVVEAEGSELYVIVPSEDVTVKVYEVVMDNNEGKLEKGKELYSDSTGKPFFLLGNMSDILPSFCVVAEKDERKTEYNPCLSLKDGKVECGVDGVTDITPYESMTDFINPEA